VSSGKIPTARHGLALGSTMRISFPIGRSPIDFRLGIGVGDRQYHGVPLVIIDVGA
jgi:hypothetical protein